MEGREVDCQQAKKARWAGEGGVSRYEFGEINISSDGGGGEGKQLEQTGSKREGERERERERERK